MDIVQEIKKFVENECKKPTSKYGYDPYTFHFIPMVKYAEKLANKLGADKEIVLIAAWLHDIGSIVHGREGHHLTGAEIAEAKLKELNYSTDKIELIKKCIQNHRGSTKSKRKSMEEKIIAEADAMSNFDNIPGIFGAAFLFEKKNQGEAKISARKKLRNKWKQLHLKDSRKIIKPKYEAAMLLLK